MIILKIEGEAAFRKHTGFNGDLNIFFSENYRNFKLSSKTGYKDYFFLYSDSYVIPVLKFKLVIFCYCEFLSEPARYNPKEESEFDFINEVCSYLKNFEKVQWISPTPVYAFFSSYPRNADVIPFGSQVIDLTLTKEELFSKMDRKHKEMTKRGEKGGVKVIIGKEELINDFCFIETALWKKSSVSVDNKANSYHKNFLNSLSANTIIGIAYHEGTAQVGLIVLFNKLVAYAISAGRGNEMEPGANNLLYWKIILYLKEIGVEKFSIVGYRIDADKGTKVYDIQRFKSRFGGELKVGYKFRIDFKPFNHKLYNVLFRSYIFLKSGKFSKNNDIIDEELHKWNNLSSISLESINS